MDRITALSVMRRQACQRKGGMPALLRRQRLFREAQNARIPSSVRICPKVPRRAKDALLF
ncbi:hypothetical protein CUJ84_Chr004721 [Rhizobium leguminosarum]|uniref:Uncharacterized protein n=1 Tax=Rhizobium leguminosarum TaxID=384 RepID=A0A2K9Z9U0_RHILE|nr:hypothetical protein CUJ84_Chr004721 [Rhizobium leguminosarum]